VKTFDFLDIPLSPSVSLHLKHIPRPNVNTLDAKGDETPKAKSKLKLIKWVGFAPRFRREETESPDLKSKALDPWTYSRTFLSTKGTG
jgi:hypothetical protein